MKREQREKCGSKNISDSHEERIRHVNSKAQEEEIKFGEAQHPPAATYGMELWVRHRNGYRLLHRPSNFGGSPFVQFPTCIYLPLHRLHFPSPADPNTQCHSLLCCHGNRNQSFHSWGFVRVATLHTEWEKSVLCLGLGCMLPKVFTEVMSESEINTTAVPSP